MILIDGNLRSIMVSTISSVSWLESSINSSNLSSILLLLKLVKEFYEIKIFYVSIVLF
jgi:hypothetical protein